MRYRVGAGGYPADAPLRTVRDPDSVGTHSSSLSKAKLVRADPLRVGKRRILRTHRNPFVQLGNTGLWPFCAALLWATAPGRTKRPASLIICFSHFEAVPQTLFPFKTRPTWADPVHVTPAFASSAISMLCLLPCLAV